METSAFSGRKKRLFHRKSIASVDAIEHVFNVVNSYLACGFSIAPPCEKNKLSGIIVTAIIYVNSFKTSQRFILWYYGYDKTINK
jgi:hypothetical protein